METSRKDTTLVHTAFGVTVQVEVQGLLGVPVDRTGLISPRGGVNHHGLRVNITVSWKHVPTIVLTLVLCGVLMFPNGSPFGVEVFLLKPSTGYPPSCSMPGCRSNYMVSFKGRLAIHRDDR